MGNCEDQEPVDTQEGRNSLSEPSGVVPTLHLVYLVLGIALQWRQGSLPGHQWISLEVLAPTCAPLISVWPSVMLWIPLILRDSEPLLLWSSGCIFHVVEAGFISSVCLPRCLLLQANLGPLEYHICNWSGLPVLSSLAKSRMFPPVSQTSWVPGELLGIAGVSSPQWARTSLLHVMGLPGKRWLSCLYRMSQGKTRRVSICIVVQASGRYLNLGCLGQWLVPSVKFLEISCLITTQNINWVHTYLCPYKSYNTKP